METVLWCVKMSFSNDKVAPDLIHRRRISERDLEATLLWKYVESYGGLLAAHLPADSALSTPCFPLRVSCFTT
jgi:hypothetical protein